MSRVDETDPWLGESEKVERQSERVVDRGCTRACLRTFSAQVGVRQSPFLNLNAVMDETSTNGTSVKSLREQQQQQQCIHNKNAIVTIPKIVDVILRRAIFFKSEISFACYSESDSIGR